MQTVGAERSLVHFHELADDLPFTRCFETEPSPQCVLLGIVAKMVEAGVALACATSTVGVRPMQVGQHDLDRCIETVKVEAEEPHPIVDSARIVESAEPAEEIEHVCVAPHPGWKPQKSTERVRGVGIVGRAAHESVHAVAIGPVSFDRDGMKTLLGDEALGSGRAGSVKLVRPVGSLAQ
jgi:hypothetical protein